jgi:hypothetical protein
MATNLTAAVAAGPARGATKPYLGSLLRTAAAAAAAAAVAAEALRLVAVAAGDPMKAGMPGEASAMELVFPSFAVMTLMLVVPGIGVALLLARFARRPANMFAILAIAVTALSLLAPLAGIVPATSTKVVLSVGHILAAAIFVLPLVRHLSSLETERR